MCIAVIAQDATILPIGFGPDNSLAGEEIGTGSLGTTFALSGITDGAPFTGVYYPSVSAFVYRALTMY